MGEIRDQVHAWMDQFEDDHYEYDLHGVKFTVDLPRETVETVLDISIELMDRVVAAKGELHTAEYKELETRNQKEADGEQWIPAAVMEAYWDEHLYGRYRDIEKRIGRMNPRGFSAGSAVYQLMIRMDVLQLVYAVIHCVDEAKENYTSLVYTFFLGILALCWGEGGGWYRTKETWGWRSAKYALELTDRRIVEKRIEYGV